MERNEEIRKIAYELWEEEGYPEGKEAEHWHRAEKIWEERNTGKKTAKTKKTAAKKSEKTAKKSSKK